MAKENKTEAFRKSYQFFRQKQNGKMQFSIEDISAATGWSISTIGTYRSKKWSDILIKQTNGQFLADLRAYPTEDSYVRMMSQNQKVSSDPFKPELPEVVVELVNKARDSAILAVDIYNRPIVSFRSQGYIVMMIIAWTALFHAIYEKDGVDYYYKKDDNYVMIGGDKKAWELNECINKSGNLISEAIKKNLSFFILLRNKIEHRYVPALDLDIFGECQAMLLNFENLMIDKFGSYGALNHSLSFPLQVSSFRPDEQQNALKKIGVEHYNELKDYIKTYRNSLADEIYTDNRYCFKVFLVPKIANHRSSSDLAVEFIRYDPKHPEEFKSIEKSIALIQEKHVQVANQGKLKPKMVCDILSERLDRKVSMPLHTSAWRYYNVRRSGNQAQGCNTKYCQFDAAHNDYVYTQEWVDFLAEKLSDPEEWEQVRNFKRK